MRYAAILAFALLGCSSAENAPPLQPTAVATYLDSDAVAREQVDRALAPYHPSAACSLGCTVHVDEADAPRARDELRRKHLANVSVID